MRSNLVALCVVLLIVMLAVPGCGKKASDGSPNVSLTKEAVGTTVAGIEWSYPSRWTKGGVRAMRVATYVVPQAEGDSDGGECAVFFFGAGQGGDVNSNIERWGSQFEDAGQAVKTTTQVNSMNVTRVEIAGTFLAPSGPMMESQGRKANYRLLGAIVEAPEGLVFFKFTGPQKTISTATAEFDAMIASITKK